jgi:hypothetical protein
MTEDKGGTLTRSETPIWIGGAQIVQLPHPSAGARPESNWPFLPRSPLLQKVVPDYVMTASMSQVAETPSLPPVRIDGGLSLDTIAPAGEGGSIEKGPPLKVVTAPDSGYFAASLPIHAPPNLFGARYAFLRARVLSGRIGIGIVDARTGMFLRRTLDPSPAPVDIYIALVEPERARNLVFFNAATSGARSEIVIEDAALVVSHQ